MVQFRAMHVFVCVMGFLSESQSSLTLEADVGDNVTIWCQHDLTDTGPVFWFKHTSDSVPLLLGCQKFRKSTPSQTCYFFTESERTVMAVHGRNTSLTITAVNVSDTGLYYCSFSEKMTFSSATSLQVKDVLYVTNSTDIAEGSVSSPAFFALSVVVGAVIAFLLCGLIFVILMHIKTHRGAEAEDNELPDSVKYVLQFCKTEMSERHDEKLYTHVVYSSFGPSSV